MGMDKSGFKIMIVNDKPELRSLIRNYLRDEGYTNLTISENGLSALKKAQTEGVDLILADYNLPGLNGLDLLKEIRRDKKLKEVPFILISSQIEQKYVAKAAEYKVSGYVLIPFSYQTLIKKVNQVLDRRINPSEGEKYYQEANSLAQSGNLTAALEMYKQALEAAKSSMAVLHYKIGRTHEALDQEGEAETDYRRAVKMSNYYVEAFDALGTLSLKKNEPEEALSYLRHSSEISPLNADRQRYLGEALLESGHFEEAEKAFRLALKLDPSQTHIFNRLGITLRQQGKLEEAARYFHKALEVAQDDENLWFNLSRVYYDQGQKEEALKHLKQALSLNPDFEEARDLIEQIRAS